MIYIRPVARGSTGHTENLSLHGGRFLNRGDRVTELSPGPDMSYLNCGE